MNYQNTKTRIKPEKRIFGRLFILVFSFLLSPCFFLLAPNVSLASTIAMPTSFLTMNAGLVGWWTFDGPRMTPNVVDTSGTGNNGNLFGQTSTTTVLGRLAQALKFDGLNDYVDAGKDASTQLTATGTISLWVKYAPQSDFAVLAGNADYFDDANGYALVICKAGCATSADGSIILELATASAHVSLQTTLGYSDNQWHHIIATWNGTAANGGNIYVDGIVVKTGTMTNVAVAGSNFALGKEIFNDIYYYKGLMDDARIYSRALTATEIGNLYGSNAVRYDKTKLPGSSNSLSTGLIGHWTFDGPNMASNVTDLSGNGNHGHLVGFTSTTTVPGEVGQALHFDGVDDKVDMGLLSSIDALSTLTISQWVRTDKDASPTFSGKFNSNPTGWDFQTEGAGSNFRQVLMVFYPSAAKGNTPAVLTPKVWHHIVGVFDGTQTGNANRLHIYVDGVDQTLTYSGTIPASISSSAASFILGGWVGGTAFYTGSMDDTYLYNRALSASEVYQLYSMGAVKHDKSRTLGSLNSGLVGWWTFDGPNMVSNVTDSSGQGNNGFLNNQTPTTTVQGKIGQALSFDGVDDNVRLADFVFDSQTQGTISAWIKLTAKPSAGFGSNIIRNDGGVNFFFIFASYGLSGTDSRLLVGSQHAGNYVYGGTSLDINKWYHVAVTSNGSTWVLYVNGVPESLTVLAGSNAGNWFHTDSTGATNYFMGTGLSAQQFNGNLDDVRVYNRVLLASEITQLYNAGR